MDWYDEVKINEKLKITFLPAVHWSKRSLTDTNKTLWGNFLIEYDGKKILLTSLYPFLGKYFTRNGYRDVNEMDWYDEVKINEKLKITFLPAVHWSKRSLTDTNKTLWGNFLIEYDGKKILLTSLYPFLGKYFTRNGYRDVNEMDWYDEVKINEKLKITFLPAVHWSKRSLTDTNKTLWGNFLIEYDGKKILLTSLYPFLGKYFTRNGYRDVNEMDWYDEV
jgi:L-ascorbate metabolism protein UlaG (beta-lactamase superfamily)